MLQRGDPRQLPADGGTGLRYFVGCGRVFTGHDLRHRPMCFEGPACSGWDIAGGDGFDFLLGCSMRGETNDGPVSAMSACPASRTGRVRVRRWAYRDAPTCRGVLRQVGGAVAVFADRLCPFLLAAPERFVSAGVGFREEADDWRQVKTGELVRVSRIVGREIDQEPILDRFGYGPSIMGCNRG